MSAAITKLSLVALVLIGVSGCHFTGHGPDFLDRPAHPSASEPAPAPDFPEPAAMPLEVPVEVPRDLRQKSNCAQRSLDNLNQRLLCRGGSITVRDMD